MRTEMGYFLDVGRVLEEKKSSSNDEVDIITEVANIQTRTTDNQSSNSEIGKLFDLGSANYQSSINILTPYSVMCDIQSDASVKKKFEELGCDLDKGICSVFSSFVAYADLLESKEKFETVFPKPIETEEVKKQKISSIARSMLAKLDILHISNKNKGLKGFDIPPDAEIISHGSPLCNQLMFYQAKKEFTIRRGFIDVLDKAPEGHYLEIGLGSVYPEDIENITSNMRKDNANGHAILVKKHKNGQYSLYDSNGFALFNIEGMGELHQVVDKILNRYAVSFYNSDPSTILSRITLMNKTILLRKLEEHLKQSPSSQEALNPASSTPQDSQPEAEPVIASSPTSDGNNEKQPQQGHVAEEAPSPTVNIPKAQSKTSIHNPIANGIKPQHEQSNTQTYPQKPKSGSYHYYLGVGATVGLVAGLIIGVIVACFKEASAAGFIAYALLGAVLVAVAVAVVVVGYGVNKYLERPKVEASQQQKTQLS